MNPILLCDEISDYCRKYSDEEIVKKYARYFKEGYDAYGLSVEIFQAKVDELTKREEITLPLIFETAPLLIQSGKYEETSFVIAMTEKKMKLLSAENFYKIGKWFEIGMHNWAHCDVLCSKVLPYFFLHGIVSTDELQKWCFSPYRYQRRVVPVAMIKLLKSTSDYQQFFEIITPLMLDPERVVHQGTGWFLREAWKKERLQTEAFLLKWKDQSPRLIFQYATEKMNKEEKLRFRKEKG